MNFCSLHSSLPASARGKKTNTEQTMYAVQTLEQINASIEQGQLDEALKYSKQFLTRLAELDISEKPKILSNLYSLMGTTYLELGKVN